MRAGDNISNPREMAIVGPFLVICLVSGILVGSCYSNFAGRSVVEALQRRFEPDLLSGGYTITVTVKGSGGGGQ